MALWHNKYRIKWTPRRDEIEEPSVHCGKFCIPEKKIRELYTWSWTLRRPSGGSVSKVFELGNALQFFKKETANAVCVIRAPAACPEPRICGATAPDFQPFFQGRRGVVCFYVSCCNTPRETSQKIYPPWKLTVFVEHVTAIFEGKGQGIGGIGIN